MIRVDSIRLNLVPRLHVVLLSSSIKNHTNTVMGKKSKRSRSRRSGTEELTLALGASSLNPGKSTAELKQALEACSLDRLRALYNEMSLLLEQPAPFMPNTPRLVTDADMSNDFVEARKTMEKQLGAIPVEPLAKVYQVTLIQQLKSMGGMKISFVSGKKSFAYTCGFAAVGGKELVLQDVHRSMSDSNISQIFNHLYARHNDGHPLAHGHTVEGNDVVYVVEAPDKVESTLLKASKTLEPTRLYGLAGYEILLLKPVGVKSSEQDDDDTDDDENKRMTRDEVLALKRGVETKGFKTLGGKVKKLEACAWCRKTRDTARQTPLMKCTACKNTFYCSREHQKLDWKNHKLECNRTNEDWCKSALEPFTEELEPFFEHHANEKKSMK